MTTERLRPQARQYRVKPVAALRAGLTELIFVPVVTLRLTVRDLTVDDLPACAWAGSSNQRILLDETTNRMHRPMIRH